MTLNELKASDKVMLTPADVAPILHCDPHAIRLCARSYPQNLGFPVSVIRSRTLIPREGFLNWLAGGQPKEMPGGRTE